MKLNKTVRLGTVTMQNEAIDVFCAIKLTAGGVLSITGVVGPKNNGDAIGSCGQIEMGLGDGGSIIPARGWSQELIKAFLTTWRAWHLNDMRAACSHQRAAGIGSRQLTVTTYRLNSAAWELKKAAEAELVKAAQEGRAAHLTHAQLFLISDEWYKDRFTPPSDTSPLAGLYEVTKREQKLSGWVYEHEHPQGDLSRKCKVCGHAYGSAWLKEAVPPEVVAFLEGLPDTDKIPAWV